MDCVLGAIDQNSTPVNEGKVVSKERLKIRRGRGFVRDSGGEIRNIKTFERLPHKISNIDTTASWIQPHESIEGWVIFVTGIHEEATEEDVKELFNEHGLIKNVVLNLDRRTGYIKGHALIEYETYQEAVAALENLNKSQLLGKTIQVDWCFTKGPMLVNYSYLKQNTNNKSNKMK